MRRTNIYLPDEQLEALRHLGEQRDQPVAELVRQAVDAWLEAQGVDVIGEDEWASRFGALLERRRGVARTLDRAQEQVDRDVLLAVREARRAASARRR